MGDKFKVGDFVKINDIDGNKHCVNYCGIIIRVHGKFLYDVKIRNNIFSFFNFNIELYDNMWFKKVNFEFLKN